MTWSLIQQRNPRNPVCVASTQDTGWTLFTPTAPSGEGSGFSGPGTRSVYVSSSTGNDSNAGTLASPKATISAGLGLLRTGKPDWLLLKKGDTWRELPGRTSKVGQDANNMMLLGAYGTGARPIIKPTAVDSNDSAFSFGSNWAVVGIEWYNSVRDTGSADFISAGQQRFACLNLATDGASNWLIEDCLIHFWEGGISCQGTVLGFTNFSLRRTVIVDQYPVSPAAAGSNGMYLAGISGTFLIEECVIDGNGWKPSRPGSTFNHNIYIDNDGNGVIGSGAPITGKVTLRGNILANDCAGLQLRSGGIVTDNLWLLSPLNSIFSAPNSVFRNNVCLESISDPTNIGGPGVGPSVSAASSTQSTSGMSIDTNIFAHPADSGSVGVGLQSSSPVVNGVSVINNIFFGVTTPISDNSGGTNTLTPNSIDLGGYPDPNRTIGGYAGTIGLSATTAAFIAAARGQSKDSWNPNYTAHAANSYVRVGFGL